MSRFLDSKEVLVIHEQVISTSGGSHGVRDVRLLESALGAPQQTFGGQDLYPDVFSQGAALLRSLAMNHPFVDGNKRTAFLSTVVFLELNMWRLDVQDAKAVEFMVDLAAKKPTIENVGEWLREHCQSI